MLKKLLLIIILSCLAFSNASAKKVLRFAADTESGAPYVFADPRIPTNLIGFEVDIMEEIAKECGFDEAVLVQNEWSGLIPGLSRGDYDVAINGIEITQDRKKVVNFTEPYYITFEQLVVRRDETEVTNLSDLIGKRCGTLKNSLAERILRSQGGIEVVSYESEINSFTDLERGRIDAVLIDHPVALYNASWKKSLKLVGQPIGEVVYGIVVKNDSVLVSNINEAIGKLKRSGRLREILESWNLWNYMMGVYLNDKSISNVNPAAYNSFIETQSEELTFEDYFNRYVSFLPLFGHAALTTIEISILSMILAIILGLILALVRVYGPEPLSFIAKMYIEIIRGTPLLIQLFFIYYALPSIGIQISPMIAAVLGLGLNYAAYEAENYRAGLFSVPRGQMEAAISLGMTRPQAIRHVIVPQAIRLVIPPVTNDFISLLKDSSLVSAITMVELTKLYYQLSSTYFDYIGPGIMVAIIYLLIGLPFVRLSQYVEKKYAIDKRKIS